MSTKAEELAAALDRWSHNYAATEDEDAMAVDSAAELRRLAGVEAEHQRREAMFKEGIDAVTAVGVQAAAERDALRARLDRAINAAVEHFGENAIRYKFTLTKSGKVMQEFPRHMDGHWYALQRADDDAHVGLSLRCVEAEAERARLAAEVEALRADSERLNWLEGITHRGYAPQVVYDDNGNWAVSFDGVMPVPQADPPDEPLMISARVEPREWAPTVRAAIDAARKEQG